MTEYAELPYITYDIKVEDMVIADAKRLVASMENLPYVDLLACLRIQGEPTKEAVLFEVEVERPQHRQYPIEKRERIAAIFTNDSDMIPEVLALRADFPQVPHLNLCEYEGPKSLCLYDESPSEVMLHWTPLKFIERIRQWLSLTAKGKLHQEDQLLEPLLLSSFGTIVLIDDVYDLITKAKNLPVFVYRVSRDSDRDLMLITRPVESVTKEDKPLFIAMGFTCGVTTHGVIRRQPKNIAELAALVKNNELDLTSQLQERLRNWCQDKSKIKNWAEAQPIVIVAIPKTRTPGGEIENIEIWVFLCDLKLIDLGVELGVWSIHDGEIGLHFELDKTMRGSTVSLLPLKPVRSFSKNAAAKLSGLPAPDNRKIVLIGAGALGSHFYLNTVRAGLGQWTIVDNDRLLPHNLARHVLDGHALGCFKAEYLSFLSNFMIDDEVVSTSIVADLFNPGKKEQELVSAMNDASVIVDASASISVARHIALDIDTSARRISTFFTPSGNASVLLAEDEERCCPLDILEMQYYRKIANSTHLKDHLMISGHPIRYGPSCRDLTSNIPQDIVTLHAALASSAFKKILDQPTAFGGIWLRDPDSQQVIFDSIQTASLIEIKNSEWQIRTDQTFLTHLSDLRASKLPNETGGIILGSYDMQRRIIYLVDTIPSPSDSEEWPTIYIRGCNGLANEVERIKEHTAGNLIYVGEWHSHPNGTSVYPSPNDKIAFNWLSVNMRSAGLPPLMIIVGCSSKVAIYIEKME